MTLGWLAQHLALPKSSASVLVKDLERRGFVRRRRDSEDERRLAIVLTAKGRRRVEADSVLEPKPLTAKIIAVLVATIVSYVLNREWSFRTRGGRERHHEAALFFIISGIGVAVYTAPLAISRYVFHLAEPNVTLLTQEIADFVSGQILGVLAGMAFRWWAFRKFVFPDEDVRRQGPDDSDPEPSQIDVEPVERS